MEGIKSLFPLVLELFSNPSTKQKRQKCSHCLNKITTYCCVIYENYDGRHSCISSHTAISVRQNKTVRCRLHYIRLQKYFVTVYSNQNCHYGFINNNFNCLSLLPLAIFQTIGECASQPVINCKQASFTCFFASRGIDFM